ncbi:Protein takeout [Cryptotermes secundus]|uniref:Protein takeout n=2 Tax=Cryptotermes secundus TaxID=105785 RepID=A0A2J7PEZ8_9NEOP|nr:Protein takeout [Cryptotermes secundus]
MSQAGKPLPPYIKPCSRFDPNINQCALEHGKEAIPHLVKGDPAYKIPPLDPFDIKEVKIIDDGPSAASISVTLTDSKIYGIRNIRMEKAEINLDQQHHRFELSVPLVQIIGQYEMSGRILLLPIAGKGNINLTLDHVYVVYNQYWKLAARDGETYMKRHNTTATATPENVHIHITNLFNGNKLLGDQMNIFLNENWKDAFKELSPTIFRAFSEVINSLVHALMAVIPFDNIYPEKVPS